MRPKAIKPTHFALRLINDASKQLIQGNHGLFTQNLSA
jgi:hypothetical protein